MSKIRYSILLAIFALLAACQSKSGDSDNVLAVSIEPQKQILQELVGAKFEIVTVMPTGANPESYEPTMSQRTAMSRAKAYFTIGFLPFEHTLAEKLAGDAVVNTSEGIDIVTGTHSHADGECHGHDADPHTWTSYANGKKIADNMLKALVAIDPDNAELYKSNYAALAARLDSLDLATAKQLQQAGAHAFAIWHPSLSYYARDYGLHQLSVGQESKEISIATLKSIIDEAKADSVRVFFFQKEYDSRQAENVNKEIGSRLVTINPLAADWEAELQKITDELTKQ